MAIHRSIRPGGLPALLAFLLLSAAGRAADFPSLDGQTHKVLNPGDTLVCPGNPSLRARIRSAPDGRSFTLETFNSGTGAVLWSVKGGEVARVRELGENGFDVIRHGFFLGMDAQGNVAVYQQIEAQDPYNSDSVYPTESDPAWSPTPYHPATTKVEGKEVGPTLGVDTDGELKIVGVAVTFDANHVPRVSPTTLWRSGH